MHGFKHIAVDELPAGWQPKHFSELADFRMGKTPPRNHDEFWKKGVYPWVSIADMEPFGTVTDTKEKVSEKAHEQVFRRALVPPGSLLMSFKLTIGRVAKLGVPAYHNEAIISFCPDTKQVDPDFLFFHLAQINYKDYQDTAVKGQTLNKGKLEQLEIALPPLPEQRRIAGVLGVVQRAIEQQERLLQLTAELKKTLLHQLFTQGLRGEPQKQTEIGPMPQSWEVVPLGDYLTQAQYGLSAKGAETGRYALLRMTNQQQGRIFGDNLQYVDLTEGQFERFRVERQDILFNRTNSLELVGRTAIFDIEGDFVFASYLIRLRTDAERLRPYFLNQYFNWDETQVRLKSIATRAVSQSNISATRLRGFPLPVPLPEEQDEIVANLDVLDRKIDIHRRKHSSLTALFRTLLHHLMTAQIRVHDLDISEPESVANM